ncbi:hypothetical protein Nepgr_001133 [Nepenthes gracilis]|uniref:Copper transport protein n=1 Tax=Nepenthes gracilis TaxID=150966 RepID=A0AAD3P3X8_NEPGR|nr:hypothetical protein Nepgr_001133 [Nepenthes gracilis]
MMHMTFYWGTEVTLLFDFWKTKNWADYSLTLVACLLFSIFYQYAEHRRLQFKQLTTSASTAAASSSPSNSNPQAAAMEAPLLLKHLKLGESLRRWGPARFAAAALFGINSAIGYMLMLAVMSFNGGVFLSVVVGLSVGYLFFRSSYEDAVVVDNPCACA